MEHHLDEVLDSVPEDIGHLALALHGQRGQTLSIEHNSAKQLLGDCEKHGRWMVKENLLEFASLEARNHCVAVHTYRENLRSLEDISPSLVFDLAYDLWCNEIGHSDSACGRFLALASERLNILQEAANLISTGERGVFDVLHVVQAALPHLPAITAEDLCAVVGAQHPKTERDLARGQIFSAIEDALMQRPTLAWELYRHLEKNVTDSTLNLVASALLALAKAGELDSVATCALQDVESENILIAQIANWVVARLMNSYELPEEIQGRCVAALRNNAQHPDSRIRQSAAQAIAHISAKEPMLLDDLLGLARSLDENILAIVANHLFMNSGAIQHYEALPELLDVLTNIPPELGGALDNMDWVLSTLLKGGSHDELVLRYLSVWVVKHGKEGVKDKESIERFDQTIMALVEKPQILQHLITEWLIADEKQLPSASSGLISFLWVRGYREPRFSKEVLDRLDPKGIIHLARRMLGFVFAEESLLSLTFSLLDTQDAPARTYGIAYSLLTKEIGRDYLGSTLDAMKLQAESASPEAQAMLESAHSELSAYKKAIDDLPVLQELRPPFQLRRAISLRRSREMRNTMDAADEQSVMLKLVTRVPIKAGVGWFSVKNGNVGDTSHFHSFSHQVSLPRRTISDPVGYAINGLLYRIAKRGAE